MTAGTTLQQETKDLFNSWRGIHALRKDEDMDTVAFCEMDDLKYQNEVVEMMRSLYMEDGAAHPVNHSIFPAAVEHLVSHPSAGQIVLIRSGNQLRGYALLIPYWSNEFGGILLFVDELFVSSAYRNHGIGRRFFLYLEQKRPFDAVALALEVGPDNRSARRLYESLGFVQRRNATLTHTLTLNYAPFCA